MDAELLDATLMPLVHQLTESREARATALVRGLDEMPLEAQHRLAALLETFSGRLRLLALCGPRPSVLAETLDEHRPSNPLVPEESARGITAKLIEVLRRFDCRESAACFPSRRHSIACHRHA